MSAIAIALVSLVWIIVYSATKKQMLHPNVEVAQAGNSKSSAAESPAPDASHETADQPPGPKPAGDFHSPRFGYAVKLADTPWVRWENLAEVVPEAEWGALLKNYGRSLVIPLALNGLDPRQEALDQALLARLGIAYPSDQLSDFQPLQRGSVTGHSFRLSREVAGAENDYRLWVVRRGDCAYLAAVWFDRAAAEKAEKTDPLAGTSELNEILSRISFDDAPPAAPKIVDLNPRQRQSQGLLFNDLGMFAYNSRDFGGAIDCFARAFELQPNDPAILTNLVNAHVELQQYREALGELEQNLNRFANYYDLWAARAFLFAKLGETDTALNAYAALFASGYRAEAPFTQYVTLLAENDRTSDALAAVENYLQSKDSFAVRRLQAGLHRQRGEHAEAIAILTELAKNRPFNAELSYDLADSFWATDRFQEALDVCRQLLDLHYDTAHTYLLQARNQYALKWYVDARASLNAALKREPTNKEVQQLLALVTATLGEGNNQAIQEAIEPVPLPASTTSTKPPTADEAAMHAYGAYVIQRQVSLRFTPGGEFTQTDRRTIRVLDPSGVGRYSTIQIPFDPVGEQIYVNSLRVTDTKGNEVAAGKTSDYYVIDGNRGQRASQAKMLNIPVPGLQPGHTIELVLTRRDLSPPAEFPYTSFVFSSDVPVLSAILYLEADEAAVHYQASRGVKMTRAENGFIWSIEQPQVYRQEPLQQPRNSYLPRVAIGSSHAKWEQLAGEYLTTIDDRLALDETVQALADQITAGAADEEARTIALTHYVQEYLTYKPIEFGRRARVPNRLPDIVQNKYGDCKDHALLLVQLLRASHIAAHLALANLDEPIDSEFPALEQFNHMLVYLPNFHGGRFIDCSDKNSDLPALGAPTDLGGQKVFVLDEKQPRFVDLPPYGPGTSRIHVARRIRLSGQTDAAVAETVTLEGYQASFLRELFRNVPAANRAAMLQEELAPVGGAMQVQSVEIENLSQRDKPLIFKAAYLLRNNFKPAEGGLLGQLPALWERMYLGVQSVPQRRTPFAIEYPLQFSSEVDLLAPEGYQLQSLANRDEHGETRFVSWKVRTQAADSGEHIDYELQLPSGRYPAADYAAYDNDLDKALAVLSPSVTLKKTR